MLTRIETQPLQIGLVLMLHFIHIRGGSKISQPQWEEREPIIRLIVSKNCMKIKEIWTGRGDVQNFTM